MTGETRQMKNNVEMICPLRLKVWGWHAVVNFFLGGSASGMYLLALLSDVMDDSGAAAPLLARLLPTVLAGLGFFIVAFEAGRPLRAPYLPLNIRSSWMSREIVIGGLFIVFGSIDALFRSPVYAALAGTAALGLIVSQGFIVYRSVAVRAWNIPLIPVLFLTSGLWSGFWLVLMVYSLTALALDSLFLTIGLILAPADFLVWIACLKLGRDNVPGDGSGHLLRSMIFTPKGVIGYLIPMATIVIVMAMTNAGMHNALTRVFTFSAGFSALTGNLLQKTGMILGDNVLRGMVMGPPKGCRERE
jgi:DMSO reductase anchor subunit